jgi:hypothetical protein
MDGLRIIAVGSTKQAKRISDKATKMLPRDILRFWNNTIVNHTKNRVLSCFKYTIMKFKIQTAVFFALLFTLSKVHAQCSGLTIIGYNTSWDTIVLQATAPISGGAVYYLTDNEWSSANSNFSDLNEGEITWTAPAGGLAVGDKVIFRGVSASGAITVVNIGTLSGAPNLNITANDDLYLTSTVPSTTPNSTTNTDICMHVDFMGTGGGDNPTNSVILGTSAASGKYTGSGSITNPANWIVNGGALPISLDRFLAKSTLNSILLSFTTVTERDNDYFDIERSGNGLSFKKIGAIKGAGTSLIPQDYTYTDEKPLRGINFYRLKQVDFDGQFSYSPVVSVVFGKVGNVVLYPTPTTSTMNVRLEEAFQTEANWQVIDLMGRIITAGIFPAEQTDTQIPVGTLSEGNYVLRITAGQEVITQKFRKIEQ